MKERKSGLRNESPKTKRIGLFHQWSIPLVLLSFVFFFFDLLCLSLKMHSIDFFQVLLEKLSFSLGGRALSFCLKGLGCSGWLALVIGVVVRAILMGEVAPQYMNGPGDGASTSRWASFDERVLLEPFPDSSSGSGSVNGPPAPGGELEAPALNQPDEEDRVRAAQEQRQLLRAVRRSEEEEAAFVEAARRLLLERRIPVEDPADVKRVSEVFLYGKNPVQVARARKALGNPNSLTIQEFLAEFEAFTDPFL